MKKWNIDIVSILLIIFASIALLGIAIKILLVFNMDR